MQTLVDLFETFEPRGEQCALVNRTGVRRLEMSYRELAELSLRMAALLAQRGVGEGDRVLLWGPNSPWWGVAYWGIIVRGAVAVPVDFMSDRARAESIANLTEAKLLLQSRFKPERIPVGQTLLLEELPFLLPEIPPATAVHHPVPDDLAQLIYTSGTTGNPKGVMLTHRNLVANLVQINRHIPIIDRDFTFLSLLPLSHMFEQMGGFFTPLYEGASIIYLRTLKPSAIMEALGEEDVFVIMAVPRLMQLLKNSIERELAEKHLDGAFRSLARWARRLPQRVRRMLFYPVQHKFGRDFTLFVSGGAALDPEVFGFWSDMGFIVIEGYGLTECAPVLCANTIDRQVAGAVGPALPGIQLKIAEGGEELLARGANVFPGYYQNERATRDAFTGDGWFRTGDIAEIDEIGWVHIKGREKELIVTGAGVNVYPDELEGVLNKIPGVKESCVIGLDRGGGEEVHAVLLLSSPDARPDEIVARANQSLDSLHQITGFTLWKEAEFPKTTTLKIRKFQVKEEILKGGKEGHGASRDQLVNLLARVTGTDAAEITEESLLVGDLGLTSIGRLELVNLLEQEFRMDIEDSQISPQTRVADVREIIGKREKVRSDKRLRFWTNSWPVRALRMLGDAFFIYPLYSMFADLETVGEEKLEKIDGPAIFIANHLSYFDQPSVMFALPAEIRYRTASAAWEEFFFGQYHGLDKLWRRFCYQYGTIFLNLFPLPTIGGFSRALSFMGKLADHGVNTLIFPEGAHSRDGKMHDFQLGLGVIVKELGIPVVPIKIEGTERVLPPEARFPRRGKVTVTFGAPLRFTVEEPREIVEKAQAAVAEL
ncbi:AMP-binding protein [Geomonas sp. Red276]